jgi:hypothetical protein
MNMNALKENRRKQFLYSKSPMDSRKWEKWTQTVITILAKWAQMARKNLGLVIKPYTPNEGTASNQIKWCKTGTSSEETHTVVTKGKETLDEQDLKFISHTDKAASTTNKSTQQYVISRY